MTYTEQQLSDAVMLMFLPDTRAKRPAADLRLRAIECLDKNPNLAGSIVRELTLDIKRVISGFSIDTAKAALQAALTEIDTENTTEFFLESQM